MNDLILHWYAFLTGLGSGIREPVSSLAFSIQIPVLSVLLFGLLGAISPCQLSTNVGALAYVGRGGVGAAVLRQATAFLVGKVVVYTLFGVLVVLIGRAFDQELIPIVVVTRKIVGPLMIVLGLYLLGVIRIPLAIGYRLSGWLEEHAGTGARGAFLLGVAFSFAFCPTLLLLFFGLTMPLALRSPIGGAFPGVFAVGMTLPLLAFAALLASGVATAKGYVAGLGRFEASCA